MASYSQVDSATGPSWDHVDITLDVALNRGNYGVRGSA